MDKNHWRTEFKKKIKALDKARRRLQSVTLEKRILSWLTHQKGLWTLFFPMNDEPDLLNLVKQCDHLGWAFPKVESEKKMNFYQISSLDTPPEQGRLVPLEEIRGCVIPGIAYDKKGTRLGRGGGYYDRFLKNFKGFKMGVVFDEGLTDKILPKEAHDQVMNIIVSPKQWIELTNIELTNEVQSGF